MLEYNEKKIVIVYYPHKQQQEINTPSIQNITCI